MQTSPMEQCTAAAMKVKQQSLYVCYESPLGIEGRSVNRYLKTSTTKQNSSMSLKQQKPVYSLLKQQIPQSNNQCYLT